MNDPAQRAESVKRTSMEQEVRKLCEQEYICFTKPSLILSATFLLLPAVHGVPTKLDSPAQKLGSHLDLPASSAVKCSGVPGQQVHYCKSTVQIFPAG